MYQSIEMQILQIVLVVLALVSPLIIGLIRGRKIFLSDNNLTKAISGGFKIGLKTALIIFISALIIFYIYIFLLGGKVHG